MKIRVKIILLAFLIGMASFAVVAQEQKTEKQIKKEWKKRLRAMDPLEFKGLLEENENLKVETNYLNKSVATNKKELDSLNSEVEVLKSTVDVQKESYNELMSKFEKANEQLERAAMMVDAVVPANGAKGKAGIGGAKDISRGDVLSNSSGVVFSVQVGVIERQEVAPKFSKSVILVKDAASGLQRIMMGAFRAFAQADNLKEQMRELGIRTAWVVAYKDGKRCKIREALAAQGLRNSQLAASTK